MYTIAFDADSLLCRNHHECQNHVLGEKVVFLLLLGSLLGLHLLWIKKLVKMGIRELGGVLGKEKV